MKNFLLPIAMTTSIIATFFLLPANTLVAQGNAVLKSTPNTPKIQAAILLDVSGSMNGLIEQAKAQLWNMVSTMGKAQCNGATPQIEIALYEYGRPGNGAGNGYVKQINSFTTDLDSLSQNLFNLTIDGGDEYCGHVIYSSLQELGWDTAATNYKVIFIAGNEDFLQGDVHYTKACDAAKRKGVLVNTIFCGDKMQGIREHWNLNSECGSGSYTNINKDATIEDIQTPYDSLLYSMNNQLNETYIAYGYGGKAKLSKQARVDSLNFKMNKSVAMKRATVKANKNLYKNATWDLVDAVADDKEALTKLNVAALPDSLKNKTQEQLQAIVAQKSNQRKKIQQDITTLNVKREAFIAAEKATKATNNTGTATLETEVEKIIKRQAAQYNMIIQ
jgi:hypothetical protein